jgi:hypothetical protein
VRGDLVDEMVEHPDERSAAGGTVVACEGRIRHIDGAKLRLTHRRSIQLEAESRKEAPPFPVHVSVPPLAPMRRIYSVRAVHAA